MKTLVFRCERAKGDTPPKDDYSQQFDSAYAEKVVGNLIGADEFCTACGPDCIFCRRPYSRRFAEKIAGVIRFPAVLPYVLEHPEQYVPQEEIPAHDILLAVNIHEQILIECIRRCKDWGTRGVVVPIEQPGWVSGAAMAEAEKVCAREKIEIAFPKPFCSLRPPKGSLLARFRREFHMGLPEVDLIVERGKITAADVKVSAPCGATYYVARRLVGKSLEDDLKYDVVARRLHSYPCTGSMAWDDEIGDTIMHVAGQAHYTILAPLGEDVHEEPDAVISPLGKALPRPVPVSENIRNIESAKEAILKVLETAESVSLETLRSAEKLTPAALSSAVLILRKAGRIKVQGTRIVRS